MSRQVAWGLSSVLVVACSSNKSEPVTETSKLAVELLQLRDPETCKGCHPAHYREWSSSMHAYAAKDPVFLAMNRRGQRETNGALGDFCINCHAPMAVRDGLTKDGLNIEQLPDFERGVSCYFCHNVAAVESDHNGKLRIANDSIMRGPISEPIPSAAHGSAYSDLLNEDHPASSAMCGGCHDIVTPAGVQLERSFREYKHGIFSKRAPGSTLAFDSCAGCHMPPKPGVAADVAGAPERTLHEHLWPGVDVPLTAFPNSAALRSAVEDCELGKSVQFFKLEVTPPGLFTFQIETGAGHNQPSGAAQDRRMWLEFLAYDESGKLLESVSSGNIKDGEVEETPVGDPRHDPNLFMLRDRIYDAEGKQVHMFWDARKSAAYPDGNASSVLPVATTTYVEGQNAVVKQYRALGPDGKLPARVTARLRMRPVGLDTLQDLVASGDLDPAVVAKMPTFTFGAQIEWTPADGVLNTISSKLTSDCVSYRCMLDPDAPECSMTSDTE
ncbi:MAG: multiheme c-type cytochrome [Polyangiales bacterium]